MIPKFLICDDITGEFEEIYIMHTQSPEFIAIIRHGALEASIEPLTWYGDPNQYEESYIAGIMREAGDEYRKYIEEYQYSRKVTCLRCGWSWKPRSNGRPAVCPDCGSAKWDTSRTGNEPGRRPKARR